MYLTEKKSGVDRPDEQHDEVELLLESYLKQTDEIVQTTENLVSNIRNTEEIVNIILDAHRNSLMLFEIRVTVATAAIGSGTLLAGLYGMNVPNSLETHSWAFAVLSGAAFLITLSVARWGIKRLAKMQKLTLHPAKKGR